MTNDELDRLRDLSARLAAEKREEEAEQVAAAVRELRTLHARYVRPVPEVGTARRPDTPTGRRRDVVYVPIPDACAVIEYEADSAEDGAEVALGLRWLEIDGEPISDEDVCLAGPAWSRVCAKAIEAAAEAAVARGEREPVEA